MRGAATALATVALLAPITASASAQEGDAGGADVSAIDGVFDPPIVRIRPGQTVEWTNDGRSPHTVDADDGSWASGDLRPDAAFDRTFPDVGAFGFFCRYHGRPGAGMAGTIVVGNAPLEGGASPGRDPVPSAPAGTVRVPGDSPTIQQAVDRAEPGGLVLIAPGVYREAVIVTTPYVTIRGEDRNDVILDGDFRLASGILVVEADGVAVENLTARHYLVDGFAWADVLGYRGSYLTADANGDDGISVSASRYGQLDHSYATGSPDAGFSVGACQPCDAVIRDVIAERNALGYSGTNAGGRLAIVNSEWRDNRAGIVLNTLDPQRFPPQRGAVVAGNHVHHNNSTTVDGKGDGSVPFGVGIVIAGGRGNRVVGNLVESQATYGIAVIPMLDERFWATADNRVEANLVRDSGRADLALAAPSAGGDCFGRNDASSSQPAAVELLYPCVGIRPFPAGGGSMAPALTALSRSIDASGGAVPHEEPREQPAAPRNLPDIPADPAAAPPNPAIAGEAVPEPYRIRAVSSIRPAGRPAIGQAVSLMGVPLVATSWWSLLLGLYGYVLPFVLYATWVAVAIWDLVRRESDAIAHRAGWMAVVLLVPFAGPLLYLGFGRSAIPAQLRLMLTAGGIVAYLVILLLGVAFAG